MACRGGGQVLGESGALPSQRGAHGARRARVLHPSPTSALQNGERRGALPPLTTPGPVPLQSSASLDSVDLKEQTATCTDRRASLPWLQPLLCLPC